MADADEAPLYGIISFDAAPPLRQVPADRPGLQCERGDEPMCRAAPPLSEVSFAMLTLAPPPAALALAFAPPRPTSARSPSSQVPPVAPTARVERPPRS